MGRANVSAMEILAAAVVASLVTFLVLRALYAARLAGAATERGLLRERVVDLEATVADQAQASELIGPVREALTRVERQVGTLERDRAEQFAALGERLTAVVVSTEAVRGQTASLAGALNASTIRGRWGEVQLRRILEHAGMLARCDFDEQVRGVSAHERGVRPDVVVRLPGGKVLVVDAKAPMTAYLTAHADDTGQPERDRLLAAHAAALRGHVESLAAKQYWSAFSASPELVVCFVPSDAVLAAALACDPDLFDAALTQRVVLAGPGTLLALLRTAAFAWQQDALADGARELLELGRTLYARLAGLGGHVTRLGTTLQRSVESYNALVGSLESRVLVTARRIQELGLVQDELPRLAPVERAPRPLTAAELIDAMDPDVARPQLDLSAEGPDEVRRVAG
ncbi:MAG TPA: DNA recombination protein RmuC [Dermatophilaceae bacterium]|nr:DNA recombination protein RmuC [Dermatophilaceae bacterium]